jgi:3-dehydroquinate dehydratase / shikimate dehydrogenase
VTAIATCRRKEFGGNFEGALDGGTGVLAKAAEAGCQIVDLEVESAEEAKPAQLDQSGALGCGPRARRCWSAFTTSRAPRDLEQAARIEAFQPGFRQSGFDGASLADNLAVLRLIEDRSLSAQVVGIAMGEEGLVSRVLGPRAGAAFTFASFADGAGDGARPGDRADAARPLPRGAA